MNRSAYAFACLLGAQALDMDHVLAQRLDPLPAPTVPLVLAPTAARTIGAAPAAPPPLAGTTAASRAYLRNEADNPGVAVLNDDRSAFGVWLTDPKLSAGFNLNPHFALETGFVNLYNRGTHYAEYTHMEDVNGALGVKGFNSYAAARYNLAVNDRLDVYGRAGRAYSQFNHRDLAGAAVTQTDTGPYAGVGARYRVSEKASVSGAFERYGDSAKWGPTNSNNNGVSAKVNLGF